MAARLAALEVYIYKTLFKLNFVNIKRYYFYYVQAQPNTNNTAINTLRERLDAAREVYHKPKKKLKSTLHFLKNIFFFVTKAARVAHETRQLSHSGNAKKKFVFI